MPRYLVPIYNTTGTVVEVEADTPAEAAESVWGSDDFQNLRGLCSQCEHNVGSLGDWDLVADRPIPTRDAVLAALTAAADDPHEVENLADAVMALLDRPADPLPYITLADEEA